MKRMNYLVGDDMKYLPILVILLLLPTVGAVGVIPAIIEGSYPTHQNTTIFFNIFDEEGGYFLVIPEENITDVVVSDCNYWCWNKTYYVPPNSSFRTGTRVEIILNANQSGLYMGKFLVIPNTSTSGAVGIIGGVAVNVKIDFYEQQTTTTTTLPNETTTTSSSTTTTVPTTTTTVHRSSSSGSSSSGHVVIGTTTTTTTTTTSTTLVTTTTTTQPLKVSIGVSPAKITLYGPATVEFRLWNAGGTVDANITIEPDENCTHLIVGELPKFVIVPDGTTIQNPIFLNVSFNTTEPVTCGISFLAKPVGYHETGPVNIRHGVRAEVISKPLNITTNSELSKQGSVVPYVGVGLLVIVAISFIIFKFYYI